MQDFNGFLPSKTGTVESDGLQRLPRKIVANSVLLFLEDGGVGDERFGPEASA
jgi:hypothetical protein